MFPLSNLLAVKPLLWLCGLLLAAVGALTVTLVVKDARNDAEVATLRGELEAAKTNLDAATTSRDTAVAANESNRTTIEDLAKRLDTAITETERLDGLLVSADNKLLAAQRDRAEAIAKLEAQRENDYANDPTCGAWGAAPVCGRITGSLLDQWREAAAAGRGDPDPRGGSAAAPAGAGERNPDGRPGPAGGPSAGDPGG